MASRPVRALSFVSNKVDEKVYVFVVYELLFVNTVVVIGHARGPVLFASFASHGLPVNKEKNAECLVFLYLDQKSLVNNVFCCFSKTENAS